MEHAVNNSKVKMAQALFAKSKLRRLKVLYFRLLLCLVISGALIGLYYLDLDNIEVQPAFSIFDVPALWLFCIVVQFAFFYADRIPVLKRWQKSLLQKIINKEKNSFEQQYLKGKRTV